MLNLLCPPFQGLANAVHFCEPDKTIEAWRIPTKLEASYAAEAFRGKCWGLTHEVYKLLMFFLAEPTDLFRKVTHYIVMVVQVVMTGKGLQNNTESKMIQASRGIAYAARVIYPVFCLTAGGKVLPVFPPSVVEEVLDSPLVKLCTVI